MKYRYTAQGDARSVIMEHSSVEKAKSKAGRMARALGRPVVLEYVNSILPRSELRIATASPASDRRMGYSIICN